MDPQRPFRPQGAFQVIPVVPAAPSAILMGSGLSGDITYMLYNPSALDAWLGYGPTSTAATGNSVIPLIGVPQAGVIVAPGGSLQSITLTGNTFFAGVSQLGSCSVYVGAGDGT